MALLTDMPQEERVLQRVEKKASTYGQHLDGTDKIDSKVDAKVIRDMYRDIVMPLTKEVQVEYLLQRTAHEQVVCSGPPGGPAELAARQHFGLPAGNLNVMPAQNIDSVFAHVMSNAAAYGVVVLESQRQGSLKEVKQLLVQSNLKIVAEVCVNEDGQGAFGRTRCVVIGKTPASPSGNDKSCIAFGTKNQSGALHRALGVFHTHGVNLTSIESLPSSDKRSADSASFTYDFFVELEGSEEQESMKRAIETLKEETTFVRQFGTFARGDTASGDLPPSKKQRTS
eukprot:TRINITY_DN5678_c0_g1_i2.p1 TRINITY_DN5678_c0_g1~~TRINITY_DN5678_c0_g1_i2.p1  ORF type:complete len:330 (+),score=53.88 TRINITY_DN5678_c0_g1_i2:139-990(+)